jgi:hypothetical protein
MEAIVQTAHAPVINLIVPDKAQATSTFHEWVRGTDLTVERRFGIA